MRLPVAPHEHSRSGRERHRREDEVARAHELGPKFEAAEIDGCRARVDDLDPGRRFPRLVEDESLVRGHDFVDAQRGRSRRRPEDALGAVARAKQVVVVGDTQQELIEDLVEKYASEDDATLERLEEARQHPKEPFVVKNLENVQGDERDVV